ncbi:hypothetical protein AB0M87_03865 [Streptomyces sp. NPDC051320]|uniref:hypothetical protein n=1 Tax=Streptomyces sp. NPDC051320 TaxID=3154644 RepID=UPI00341A3A90
MPEDRGDEFTPHTCVGQPFADIGRTGRMAILGFGEPVSWEAPSGAGSLTGSRYALHVSCPFRVTQGTRIVVGSEDLRRAGGASFDRGAAALDGYLARVAPLVEAVRVAPTGDLRIDIQHGIAVEVFPATPSRAEAWRLLERFGTHVAFPA